MTMRFKPSLTLITTSYPITGNGSEAAGSFVADLVQALSRHVMVRVVAPGPRSEKEVHAERIYVYRYQAPFKALSTLKPWLPADLLWINRVLRGGLRATRQAVQDGSQQIFALWALPSGEWARRIAREFNIGYSVWMLGSDVWTLGRMPIARGMLSKVIQNASNAYADGYKLAAEATAISGRPVEFLPSTRAIQIHCSKTPRSQAPYRLLFLGRWHPNKGVDILLEALNILTDDDWKAIEKIEIQGGGPLKALVEFQIKKMQALGRPIELGRFLNKTEAEQAITRADCVLIPSRIESIPVIFSDAMKLRRPVVSMPVGDLPILVRASHCGILSEHVTAQSFAQGIRQFLKSDTKDFNEGIERQATIFNIEKIAAEIAMPLTDRYG